MRTLKALPLLPLLLHAAGWTQITAPGDVRRTTSEKFIGQFEPSTTVGLPIFSSDRRHMAYVAQVGSKRFVVLDGKKEKSYDGIVAGSLVFSPDSRRVAYWAAVGQTRFVVVDGKEGKSYDGSPKGTRIVFDSANALHYIAFKMKAKAGNTSLDVFLVEETID